MDRRSIRFRLAASFALTFAIGGAAVTGVGYVIVRSSLPAPLTARQLDDVATVPGLLSRASAADGKTGPRETSPSRTREAGGVRRVAAVAAVPAAAVPTVQLAQARQREEGLRTALAWFLVALLGVLAASVAAGWHAAGRALAPIRQITATAQDVSADRLGARIALDGPDDELRELATTFDRMLDRLEAAFTAQRRFVASASHELRTPLALLRAEADVALGDPEAGDADLREALIQVRGTAERGGGLVDALLLLARGESSAHREPVDLEALVEGAVASAKPSAVAAGVAVDVGDPDLDLDLTVASSPRLDDDSSAVRGDPALLRALVDNLLSNAIAYNERNGTVRVSLRRRDDTLALCIRNTGPVVSAREVDDLFAPFVRGEPSRARRTGGAGLGLAIVRTVAEAHGGSAMAVARTGGGLEVTVVLPTAPHPRSE